MEHYFFIFCYVSLLSYIIIPEAKPTKKSSKENEVVTLIFVGDINFDGPTRYYAERGFSTYNSSFEFVAKHIRKADYAIGNLESSLGTEKMIKHPVSAVKSVYLMAYPESVRALSFAGIDCVTLANNHINDFGEAPIELTLKKLKSEGIDSFGLSRGKTYASQIPLIKNIKGIKFGFLGYCDIIDDVKYADDVLVRSQFKTGMAVYSEEAVKKDVNKLKDNNVDIIVVYIHWGQDYILKLDDKTIKKGEFLKSLGIHIIIGSHPHVIQGHGYYNTSFMSYSIGQFLFGQHHTGFQWFQSTPSWASKNITEETVKEYERLGSRSMSPSKDTMILKVQVKKDGFISATYLPCEIELNLKKKGLQVVPTIEDEWIDVCSKSDPLCLHNDKSIT